MPREDIETLRRIYEAASRRDWDAAFLDAQPEFEYKLPDRDPLAGTYRGAETARSVFQDQLAAFDEARADPEQFFERGDRIVVFFRLRARPRGSSAEIEIRVAHVWTMRDGMVARCELFPVRQEALEAAGLSEQDAHADRRE